MNKVILMGRLVRDPEMTTLSSGVNKTVFTIATDGFSKDAESDFHKITAWRTTAEFVKKHFHKGEMIMVEGKNTSGKYEKDGNTIYTYEVTADRVEFTGSKKETGSAQPAAQTSATRTASTAPDAAAPTPAANEKESNYWELDL